jgi:uncharacterized membrane protein
MMSLVGRFHPLLVHFPIALVLTAAGAEVIAMWTQRDVWRSIAVINLRAGALSGAITLLAGWVLASAPFIDATPSLALHKWTGVAAAAAATGAALASTSRALQSRRLLLVYRGALLGAAILVAIAAHLGGTLVWGGNFLRP